MSPVPRIGDWFQTLKGRKVWPLDPRHEDVDIDEIAHALSNICRFNGHTPEFVSVAQHSVNVMRCVESLAPGCLAHVALTALLHDAPEAYIGDVIRPIKHSGGVTSAWVAAERSWAIMIGETFGLGDALHFLPDVVKQADDMVLLAERRDLLAQPPEMWREHEYPPWGETIYSQTPATARRVFRAHFARLTAMHLWQASLSVVGSDYSAIKEADVLHRIDRIVGTQKEEK